MSALAEFFHGTDSTLGVFYPSHCLVAIFLQQQKAVQAGDWLRDAGFTQDNVIAVSGKDVIEFERQRTGWAGLAMQALSRFFKTEQAYADHDLELAQQGAGFLISRCINDAAKQDAWNLIKVSDPWDARYYGAGAVEHLAGDPDTD
jgi:hypothetical protein